MVAIACGLLLALAAQTAGLGPEGVRKGLFDPSFFPHHGGGLGEVLYWATTTLFQRLGAQIIAVLLLVSGLLLLTGRSVSDLVRAGRRGFDRAKRGTVGFATAIKESRIHTDPDLIDTTPADTEPVFGPPEPVADGDDFQVIVGGDECGDREGRELRRRGPGRRRARHERAAGPGGDGRDDQGCQAKRARTRHARKRSRGRCRLMAKPCQTRRPDLTPMGEKRGGVTESEEIDYDAARSPSACSSAAAPDKGPDKQDHEAVARNLLETLGHFGVEAKIVGTVTGPHVSRYELKLAPGTKVSKITQLKDDLAYALASTDIRILAPIPGKQAVGVEVPNQRRRLVRLGDIYGGRPQGGSPLVAWLGKDISGSAVWTDLQKMPHALIAGTTGSGKSGSVNAILSSILLHASPNEVRMVLVDPKRVELNHYERIPHLLTPVVTSPRLAANVLNNLIAEMESRYQIMEQARSRNLGELNSVREREGEAPLPYILCVIDELADLMMVSPAEVEDAIIRLAQKARAVGIHLLLATQRPSTDIITGTIKVNIPSRIAFAVSSQVDSRVILDQGGAETLLGQGDMLFRPAGHLEDAADPGRLHHRGRDRQDHRLTGPTRASPTSPRSCSRRRSRRHERGRRRRRLRSGLRRPAQPGRAARGRERHGLRLDDPAPPARRLHPRRPPDRHARAPRDHLRLRGLQAAPGAGLDRGSAAGAGRGRGATGGSLRAGRGARRRRVATPRWDAQPSHSNGKSPHRREWVQ